MCVIQSRICSIIIFFKEINSKIKKETPGCLYISKYVFLYESLENIINLYIYIQICLNYIWNNRIAKTIIYVYLNTFIHQNQLLTLRYIQYLENVDLNWRMRIKTSKQFLELLFFFFSCLFFYRVCVCSILLT